MFNLSSKQTIKLSKMKESSYNILFHNRKKGMILNMGLTKDWSANDIRK